MGQTINATMKQFNGTDSDDILLTPEPHASSHNVGGSDPLTVQTGNLAEDCVTNDKIAERAVTEGKIAEASVNKWNGKQDALNDDQKRHIFVQSTRPTMSDGDIWIQI